MIRSWRNLRIGLRLSLGLSLILALTMGVATIAVTGAREPRRQLAALVSDSTSRLTTVARLRELLLQQELMARRLAGATTFDESRVVMGAIRTKQSELAAVLATMQQQMHLDEERPRVAEIARLCMDAAPGTQAAADSVELFNPMQASQILAKQVSPLHISALFALDELVRGHMRRIESRTADLEAAAGRADRAILGMSLLALALAAVVAVRLTKGITDPLGQAVRFAQALGSGRLDEQAPIASGDETGVLLLTLAEMAGRLGEARKRLEKLSIEDALTGVHNRRHFEAVLAAEHARARRARVESGTASPGAALCLLLLDVDHFKRFNDRFGHPAGDACLQQVAAAVRRAGLRASDVVARYGGEEFAVIMPACAEPEAAAERVRAAVEACAIPTGSTEMPHVTVSIGVAMAVDPLVCGAPQLLKAADEALYEVKENGRNGWRMRRVGAPDEVAAVAAAAA